MAHIQLPEGLPGIRGPMAFSPETAHPLNGLANALLRPDDPAGLSWGERELIATYVSSLNDCFFCQTIHGAVASHHLGDNDWSLVKAVKSDYQQTSISSKLKSLLAIAASVQQGGKHVTAEQVEAARMEGATDKNIHDTVLIAAAFCMFNRYVDGLATWAPDSPDLYRYRAERIAEGGYVSGDAYMPPAELTT
ncbi:carboxymuconolactone decarboxylase family protein [Spirosoma endbachense]|uniref:Carboxymuconolactone decarboxylase family protein n=1 Tax=Spirosoma endbachense TaxID=2666025 RepID=A0A6P1VXX8_9BACT|nr:carboxymuconolactone decarboxylase family protein [Spirosoma endbachense]QHV97983.1 carboxymuconolactone decarboxylase family protein [Spirosoma endbachense]